MRTQAVRCAYSRHSITADSEQGTSRNGTLSQCWKPRNTLDACLQNWERTRRIPSMSTTNDPLMRIFDKFDRDRDGHLTAKELAAALQSRNVKVSEEQIQRFIEGMPPCV